MNSNKHNLKFRTRGPKWSSHISFERSLRDEYFDTPHVGITQERD
jgi:hypothetical protein